jgi:hypothetical protein
MLSGIMDISAVRGVPGEEQMNRSRSSSYELNRNGRVSRPMMLHQSQIFSRSPMSRQQQ